MSFDIKVKTKSVLADLLTPIQIYTAIRDKFPKSILLESSDYHNREDCRSFICLDPIADFIMERDLLIQNYPNGKSDINKINHEFSFGQKMNDFISCFKLDKKYDFNGLFGYSSYDAVVNFEDIKLYNLDKTNDEDTAKFHFSFYRFIIVFDHFFQNIQIIENVIENEESQMEKILSIISKGSFPKFGFKVNDDKSSNISDEQFMELVKKGKKACKRGDVFQIVLSRKFKQSFIGDDFNVYRALRSINPSPYLFYFDYGSYKIFGSSPESQVFIKGDKVNIDAIAGTVSRVLNNQDDSINVTKLVNDEKENAEHVMLVDLARNDLSRNSDSVRVKDYKKIEYFSHVIHMVSVIEADLNSKADKIKVWTDSFPAGTVTGAPKYKAMKLIDEWENENRGIYAGSIGFIGFNGDINQAITIRTFFSKDNTLFYQAGAGIISKSDERSELNEVNNKLMALKKAIELAEKI